MKIVSYLCFVVWEVFLSHCCVVFVVYLCESWDEELTFSVVRVLLATSQTTRPKAYMSAALNDSKLDLFSVSSNT